MKRPTFCIFWCKWVFHIYNGNHQKKSSQFVDSLGPRIYSATWVVTSTKPYWWLVKCWPQKNPWAVPYAAEMCPGGCAGADGRCATLRSKIHPRLKIYIQDILSIIYRVAKHRICWWCWTKSPLKRVSIEIWYTYWGPFPENTLHRCYTSPNLLVASSFILTNATWHLVTAASLPSISYWRSLHFYDLARARMDKFESWADICSLHHSMASGKQIPSWRTLGNGHSQMKGNRQSIMNRYG